MSSDISQSNVDIGEPTTETKHVSIETATTAATKIVPTATEKESKKRKKRESIKKIKLHSHPQVVKASKKRLKKPKLMEMANNNSIPDLKKPAPAVRSRLKRKLSPGGEHLPDLSLTNARDQDSTAQETDKKTKKPKTEKQKKPRKPRSTKDHQTTASSSSSLVSKSPTTTEKSTALKTSLTDDTFLSSLPPFALAAVQADENYLRYGSPANPNQNGEELGLEPVRKKQRKNRKRIRLLEIDGSVTKEEVFRNIRTVAKEILQYLFLSPSSSSSCSSSSSFPPSDIGNTLKTNAIQKPEQQDDIEWPFSNLLRAFSPQKNTLDDHTLILTHSLPLAPLTWTDHDRVVWLLQFEIALFNNIHNDLNQYVRQMELFYAIVCRYGVDKFLACDPGQVAVYDFENEYLMHSFVQLQQKKQQTEERNKASLSIDSILGTNQSNNSKALWFLKCTKCGSKSRFQAVQTRGGDEGMTIYYQCENALCGKRWKG